MKLHFDPKVFLVARSQLFQPGVQLLLQDEGVTDWSPAGTGASDADVIPELAGRLCYHSYNTPRPGGNKAYLRHIIESGHGSVLEHVSWSFVFTGVSRTLCYGPDTDVMTPGGWTKITDLKTGDEILTMDPVTKKARWSLIRSTHSFDYDGDLLGWSTSQMTSPLMTPDHLLWAAKIDLRRARGLSIDENMRRYAEKLPFGELFGKQFVVQNDIIMDADDPKTILVGKTEYNSRDFFTWLGWVATDGGLSKIHKNKVTIVQSKSDNVLAITHLMNRLFGDRWRRNGPYNDSGLVNFNIHDHDLAVFVRRNLGSCKITRQFSRWLIDSSPRLLSHFLDAAIAGDGTVHHENGHRCLYCPSEVAAGQYQLIAAKVGTPANLRIDNRVGRTRLMKTGVHIKNNRVCYVLDFDRRGGSSLIRRRHQYKVPYSGKVYCPKTDDGIIFVKGSGQPFWCGNSHELVRHRAGFAYSQRSQRYVDEGDCSVVVPHDLRDEVTAAESFINQHREWLLIPYNGHADDLTLVATALHKINELAVEHPGEPAVVGLKWLKAQLLACQCYRDKVVYMQNRLKQEAYDARGPDDVGRGVDEWYALMPTDFKTSIRKAARGCARSVLSNATETKIMVTANARSWRHFLEMRAAKPAEVEIRKLAYQVYKVLVADAPNLFGDYVEELLPDGTVCLKTEFRKV